MLVVASEKSFDILDVKDKDTKNKFIKNIEEHANYGLNKMFEEKESYNDSSHLLLLLFNRMDK